MTMITIPTSELIGGISDVIAFAADDKDDPQHGIVIGWNGEELSFAATDAMTGAVSTWTPGMGDERFTDDLAGMRGTADLVEALRGIQWGTFDDDNNAPWKVFVSHADAKDIVKVFKLAAKFRMTPLTVEPSVSASRLIVARERQVWCNRHTMTIDASLDNLAKFPRVEMFAQRALAREVGDQPEGPLTVTFNQLYLARLGAVRDYPCRLVYNGEGAPTGVSVGATFVGFIYPTGMSKSTAAKAARGVDLRHGAGLVTSGTA